MSWSRARQVRYAHHVLLPDVGGRGQDRITAATAVIAIDGRAGQVAALYLAAAGVGTLALRGGTAPGQAGFPLDAGAATVADALVAAVVARNPEVLLRAAAPDEAALVIADDDPRLPLADALARGGEAAARWLHARATDEAA